MRAQGAKLRFYDLYSEGQKIQIMANASLSSLLSLSSHLEYKLVETDGTGARTSQ